MMFTKTQGQELIDHTTSTWTSINGVNGRKFTSKTDSSKYIFLPAGGDWDGTTHYNSGSDGSYWSAMWYSSSKAWHLYFSSGRVGCSGLYQGLGLSIRSVRNRQLQLAVVVRLPRQPPPTLLIGETTSPIPSLSSSENTISILHGHSQDWGAFFLNLPKLS